MQHRVVSSEMNLAPDHLDCVVGSGHTSSCDRAFVAELAVTFPEDYTEQEMSDLAAHATTCAACGLIFSQYQELKRILTAYTEQEQDVYENEPEFHISPRLRVALTEHELQKQ